jgi:transposase, IS30 family
MTYRQLTQEQRYQIYACMKADWSQHNIAAEIGVHPSTISREVKRNRGRQGHRPKQADQLAQARKLSHLTLRIEPQTWKLIESYLRQDWSREQVAGWLFEHHHLRVSHERIYQYIYSDKARGGTLFQHLRCRRKRRKRYGSYDRRGRLTGCRSISERPQVVQQKRRIGDWEADTILGCVYISRLSSLNATRYFI